MELVRCRVAFATDFDHIVEVPFTVAFKLNIQFDSQTCSNVADVLVVATEIGSLGLCELEAFKVLCNVTNSNSHFVVLVWLDVYKKEC